MRPRISRRMLSTVIIGVGFVLGLGFYALTLGEYPISIPDLFAALVGDGSAGVRRIVTEWRLPRVLLAIIAGAAIAVSGGIFQSITRNPLGSPDIIGFTTGSYTGVLLVSLVFGGDYLMAAVGALTGGVVTGVVVYLLSYRRGVQGFRLIVVGIAVSFFLQAVNGWLIIQTDLESALAAASWSAGSFNLVTWSDLIIVGSVVVLVAPVIVVVSQRLRVLELGDDAAIGLGVNVERSRIVALSAAIVLVAVTTAVVGPIAFIALASPQISRIVTRSAGIALLPTAVFGAALTLGSDVIAQRIFAPMQLPVGVVTVVIGGIYLVFLLIRQSRKS